MKNLTRKQFITFLKSTGACAQGLSWVSKTSGTPKDLWTKCGTPYWLRWVTDHLSFVGGAAWTITTEWDAESYRINREVNEEFFAARRAVFDAYRAETGLNYYLDSPDDVALRKAYDRAQLAHRLIDAKRNRKLNRLTKAAACRACDKIREAFPWQKIQAHILTSLGK
jgi:hypothetical protein